MHKLTLHLIISLTVLFTPWTIAQDIVFSDKSEPMVTKYDKKGPKLNVSITSSGKYSIDEVVFTTKQLLVVFKKAYMLNPKVTLLITSPKNIDNNHIIKLLNTSAEAKIRFVAFVQTEEKNRQNKSQHPTVSS